MTALHPTRRALALSLALALGICLAIFPVAPGAQEAQGPHLSIELNTLEPSEDGCRISFLIQNGHDSDIDQAVFEAVLFDAEGRVERLTLFDFGDLPSARPRVRQFVVPGLACDGIARLLINGADTCTGTSLPDDACSGGLELRSRTDVEILG